MNLRSFADNTLCMHTHAHARTRKQWIFTAAALATSIASSIFGGAQSAKAQQKAMQMQENQRLRDEASIRRQKEQSYVDTKAGQNLIRQARELADRQTKKVRGSQALGGATDAAVALQKEQNNKMIGDAVANIAARDTERQDRADREMREVDRRHTDLQASYEQQRGANIAQVASNLGNAASSFIAGLEGGGGSKRTRNSTGV
jgi:hypothetical protein